MTRRGGARSRSRRAWREPGSSPGSAGSRVERGSAGGNDHDRADEVAETATTPSDAGAQQPAGPTSNGDATEAGTDDVEPAEADATDDAGTDATPDAGATADAEADETAVTATADEEETAGDGDGAAGAAAEPVPQTSPATTPGRAGRHLTVALVLNRMGRVLIGAGVIILLFVGYQLWGTNLQEHRSQDQLESSFSDTLAQLETVDPDVLASVRGQ